MSAAEVTRVIIGDGDGVNLADWVPDIDDLPLAVRFKDKLAPASVTSPSPGSSESVSKALQDNFFRDSRNIWPKF